MNQYGPVDARVYRALAEQLVPGLTINKGTSDGVHRGDPVINGAGLVGKVETATGGSAVVTLITDPEFATGGIAAPRASRAASFPPSARPATCCSSSSTTPRVRKGEIVYTAGTISSRLESRYPPAIPIGTIERIDLGDGELDRRIHIKPAADLRGVDKVQVLTEPHADLEGK